MLVIWRIFNGQDCRNQCYSIHYCHGRSSRHRLEILYVLFSSLSLCPRDKNADHKKRGIDDTIYTERYMSTLAKNPAGYEQSAVRNMEGFKHVDFALAHGSGDDNGPSPPSFRHMHKTNHKS